MSRPLPALYAILDVDLARARGCQPLDLLEIWLAAGIRLVQLRAKSLTFGPMLALADAMVSRVRAAAGMVIINDRVDVARLADADGVHVGQTDISPADARRMLGVERIVGLSTHSAGQVDAALSQPIDYLAIGPVFSTTSKERPDPIVGLDGVRLAAKRVGGLPIVAIGGITMETAAEVLASGATSVAVISDLLSQDPRARAKQWLDAVGEL